MALLPALTNNYRKYSLLKETRIIKFEKRQICFIEHGVLQETRKTASSAAWCQNFSRPDNNFKISKGTGTKEVKNRIRKLPVLKVRACMGRQHFSAFPSFPSRTSKS